VARHRDGAMGFFVTAHVTRVDIKDYNET